MNDSGRVYQSRQGGRCAMVENHYLFVAEAYLVKEDVSRATKAEGQQPDSCVPMNLLEQKPLQAARATKTSSKPAQRRKQIMEDCLFTQ